MSVDVAWKGSLWKNLPLEVKSGDVVGDVVDVDVLPALDGTIGDTASL
jgi:hypothetical protein